MNGKLNAMSDKMRRAVSALRKYFNEPGYEHRKLLTAPMVGLPMAGAGYLRKKLRRKRMNEEDENFQQSIDNTLIGLGIATSTLGAGRFATSALVKKLTDKAKTSTYFSDKLREAATYNP